MANGDTGRERNGWNPSLVMQIFIVILTSLVSTLTTIYSMKDQVMAQTTSSIQNVKSELINHEAEALKSYVTKEMFWEWKMLLQNQHHQTMAALSRLETRLVKGR